MNQENWIPLRAHCSTTGDRPAEVQRRILSGAWDERHYRRLPDGSIEVSVFGYSSWVEGGTPASLAEPHTEPRVALYRCFDADSRLLYVGISIGVLSRTKAHTKSSLWVYEVSRIEIDWHPDRRTAAEAERVAIQREKPLFNLTHAGR